MTASNVVDAPDDLLLDHLTIAGANAADASASAYGIRVLNSFGLRIRRCSIQAGNGASGSDGQSVGAVGGSGSNGTNGYNGFEDDDDWYCVGNQPNPPLISGGGASYVGGN